MSRIKLDALLNTRDLSEMEHSEEIKIKSGKIIRSGALYQASKEDLEKLKKDYNLKAIIDFRNDIEISGEADPEIKGVKYYKNTILKEKANGITFPKRKETEEEQVHELVGYLKNLKDDPFKNVCKLYVKFITKDQCIESYRQFIKRLLVPLDGSYLYHCSAGKDRAGVATLFVLVILGYSKETIINDYLITNDYIGGGYEIVLKKFDKYGINEEQPRKALKALFSVDRRYIERIYEVMDLDFGGINGYIKNILKITPEEITQLKEIYLEKN